MGMAGAASSPSAEHLHFALLPADREIPPLDEPALDKIAAYFLPRLLQYPYRTGAECSQSRFAAADLKYPSVNLPASSAPASRVTWNSRSKWCRSYLRRTTRSAPAIRLRNHSSTVASTALESPEHHDDTNENRGRAHGRGHTYLLSCGEIRSTRARRWASELPVSSSLASEWMRHDLLLMVKPAAESTTWRAATESKEHAGMP